MIPTTVIAIFLMLNSLTSANLDFKCQKLNISLIQKIDKEGFHRELNWLLEYDEHSLLCTFMIHLKVGPDIYLNPDEIEDLKRTGHITALISGEVNAEVPAHLATEHIAYFFIPASEGRIALKVPFHLRYQRAQISGSFGQVHLTKPSILGICPQKCNRAEVKAPCDVRSNDQCVWENVSYQLFFNEDELLVPIGDLDDYPLVSVITLLLGCVGCIYTLSVLSTSPL